MITKIPVVGQYVVRNYSWSVYQITAITPNKIDMQLVSKFRSKKRVFIKNSKFTETLSDNDYHRYYTDDVSSILQPELDTILENYKKVMQ